MIERAMENAAVRLAERKTRRSFLGRLGSGIVAFVGGSVVVAALDPGRAEAYHLCGHTFTTGSCPHPFHPRTRLDRYGRPLHPRYGYPVDDKGNPYRSRRQRRRKVCQQVVPAKYPYVKNPRFGGGWSRCCGGRIRRIYDCCSSSRTRINGDASVRGYCYNRTRVFCIGYRDTGTRC